MLISCFELMQVNVKLEKIVSGLFKQMHKTLRQHVAFFNFQSSQQLRHGLNVAGKSASHD
jgi:hypothetical protein